VGNPVQHSRGPPPASVIHGRAAPWAGPGRADKRPAGGVGGVKIDHPVGCVADSETGLCRVAVGRATVPRPPFASETDLCRAAVGCATVPRPLAACRLAGSGERVEGGGQTCARWTGGQQEQSGKGRRTGGLHACKRAGRQADSGGQTSGGVRSLPEVAQADRAPPPSHPLGPLLPTGPALARRHKRFQTSCSATSSAVTFEF
jgi:hypothetical protein